MQPAAQRRQRIRLTMLSICTALKDCVCRQSTPTGPRDQRVQSAQTIKVKTVRYWYSGGGVVLALLGEGAG